MDRRTSENSRLPQFGTSDRYHAARAAMNEHKWSIARTIAYVLVVLLAAIGLYRAEQAVDEVEREARTRSVVTCEEGNRTKAAIVAYLETIYTDLPEPSEEATRRMVLARGVFSPRDCTQLLEVRPR